MQNEKDIKNSFIVDDEKYNKEKLEKLAKIAIKYVRVSKDGNILIEDPGLSCENKLKLSLVARFIAHEFDDNIPSSIRLLDLGEALGNQRLEAVGSRLSELVRSGFAKRIERGYYMVHYHKIETFLLGLNDLKDFSISGNVKKGKKKTRITERATKGIGKDIQELIDDNFFNTPKKIGEVKKKLDEEVKFHDARVIDATVRKTFVKSKKLLKRIPCEKQGKAKWQYVVRR